MQQIELFKYRKVISLTTGIISILILLLYVIDLWFGWELMSPYSIFSILLIYELVYQYCNFNKFYIHFNKTIVEWNFPEMNNPKSENMTENAFEINENWKGILIKNGTKKIEISTDGLWDRDKHIICKKMKEYYM